MKLVLNFTHWPTILWLKIIKVGFRSNLCRINCKTKFFVALQSECGVRVIKWFWWWVSPSLKSLEVNCAHAWSHFHLPLEPHSLQKMIFANPNGLHHHLHLPLGHLLTIQSHLSDPTLRRNKGHGQTKTQSTQKNSRLFSVDNYPPFNTFRGWPNPTLISFGLHRLGRDPPYLTHLTPVELPWPILHSWNWMLCSKFTLYPYLGAYGEFYLYFCVVFGIRMKFFFW